VVSANQSELVNVLPKVQDQPALRDGALGFSYIALPDETYVPPTLRRAAESTARPSLVLVDARAAVGKSMLARHLAWASGGPLWDLSTTYVGTGTLWGSLAKAYGPEELNVLIGRAATGNFVLVIDALDEAEMHATGRAFDAFLIELRDMFAAPRPMPSAVILGRTETVDYIESFLGGSVPVSRYRIMDFDRDLAYRFVDKRLDTGRIADPSFTAGAHRRHGKLYVSARDRLFGFLIDRLMPDRERAHTGQANAADKTWPIRIGSFLGYAPVLEAIAEYLASYAANFPALLAELNKMELDPYHSGNAQWDMLRAIVLRLLQREEEKVVSQLKKSMPRAQDMDWSKFYGPDEQCRFILGRTTHTAALQDSALDIPAEAMASYKEVLKSAIPNHPFLGKASGYANVVFRDYLHAWGLCSTDNDVRIAVRSELRSAEYLASPLLGPFVLASSVNDSLPAVDSEDVGFVYESLLTHGETDFYLFAEPGKPANVFVGSDPSADVAVFQVVNPDNGVQFWRRLLRAQIRGEVVVQLGFKERNFSLGPDVNIESVIVEVPCREVRIYTNHGHDVHLSASAGYLTGDVEPELSKFGAGELAISWESPRYPWVEFATPADQQNVTSPWDDPAIKDAFGLMCRVAQKFATSHRVRRPFWGPVTSVRLLAGTPLEEMLSWLIREKIVIMLSHPSSYYAVPRSSPHYFLDVQRLGEYGVRLFDLCARTETPGALVLTRRFVDDG